MPKDLDINRFLDMCKYHNTEILKEVTEGMKEGGFDCTVQQVHHWCKS